MKTKRCIAQRIPETTQHVAAGCCNAALARSLIKIVEGTIDTLANPSHKPKNGKSEIFGISFFAT